MRFNVRSSIVLPMVALTVGSVVAGAQPGAVAPTEISQQVRKHLMSLPYYGVFDLLTLNVDDNGVVTLGGYVFMATLKKDAEREAREVKGVTEVQNRIELAPVSQLDDEIRHAEYHAIYGDPSLSRYGTPDSESLSGRPGLRPWGGGFDGFGRLGGSGPGIAGRRPFGGPSMMGAPFYGYDPVGNYAIHILVKNRVVTLAGVVDNDGDKNIANIKARGIKDVTQVNNELEVAPH
jgi:hyperosmotically inducible protein